MIKSFSPHACAFDCEWTPCPTTARCLLGLPADTEDRTANAAMWDHYRKDSDNDGQPFLKLVLSKVVSIAAVIRQQDARMGMSLTLYALHCDEAGETTPIGDFLEMVAPVFGSNTFSVSLVE